MMELKVNELMELIPSRANKRVCRAILALAQSKLREGYYTLLLSYSANEDYYKREDVSPEQQRKAFKQIQKLEVFSLVREAKRGVNYQEHAVVDSWLTIEEVEDEKVEIVHVGASRDSLSDAFFSLCEDFGEDEAWRIFGEVKREQILRGWTRLSSKRFRFLVADICS